MKTPLKQFCDLADKALNDVMGDEQSKGKHCFDDIRLVEWLFFPEKNEEENEEKNEEKNRENKAGNETRYDQIYNWLQEQDPRRLHWEWKCMAGIFNRVIKNENAYVDMEGAFQEKDGPAERTEKCYEIYYDFLERLEESIKEKLADLSVRSINMLSFGKIVILFLIMGYYGDEIVKKIPRSVNTKYFVRRAEVEEKLDLNDTRFIQVMGPHWSGKTTLLINYAEKREIKVIYFEEKITFESFIEGIAFESEKYIREICKIDHGRHTLSCLKKMTKPLWIILAGAAINIELIERLKALNPAITIIIEETEKALQDDSLFDEANVIEIKPMDRNETRQLFNLIKGKYPPCSETSNPELAAVQDAIQNNPILTILVAEQYWSLVKDGKEDAAKQFLDDVVAFQVDDKEYGEIYSTISYEDSGRQGQHKILSHIKRLFRECVPEIEKNAFYVLSLISSVELKMQYITKWFGIKEELIEELARSGWCVVNADSMKVGIPQLIIHALKYDNYKSAGESKGFKTYIENMTETILRNEVAGIEVETMEKVILCLHNELLEKIHVYKTLISETECMYHFACIQYFLDYGNSVDVRKLISETFEYEGIRDCKGSSLYFDTLKLIMESEDANDSGIIIDGLMNILSSERMSQLIKLAKGEAGYARLLECMIYAVIHGMETFFQGEVVNYVLDWSKGAPKEEDAGKYELKFNMFWILTECLKKECEEISSMRPQIGKVWVVCMIYNLTIISFVRGFPLKDRMAFEEKLLEQFKIITENKESIANMEIELLAKGLFLLAYEQSCFEAGWTGKQDEDDRFVSQLLQNKVNGILELREKFIELPVKLGFVFYAAKWMAGCLFGNRLDLMTIDERDFRNIRNQKGIEKDLKKMIQEYRIKTEGNPA